VLPPWRTRGGRVLLRVVLYATTLIVGLPLAFSQMMIKPLRQPASHVPPGYEEAYVFADGLRLRTWTLRGEPERAAVIVTHGVGDSLESFTGVASVLHRRGHTVLLLDLRGHGGSEGRYTSLGGREKDDVRAALRHLRGRGLAGRGFILMGFSMGTGEVTRYIGKYGTRRVRKAVLIGALGPYLVKTADNPEGVDAGVFAGIKAAIKADRPTLLLDFIRNFYNYDVLGGKLVSERVVEDNWNVAVGASAIGTLACVDAWVEDFRKDIPKNDVPTLLLHGDADRILPPDASSRRLAKLIKNIKFVELKDGPHGVLWTHADQINAELVPFLA